jgi:serine/threonine-protein kinase
MAPEQTTCEKDVDARADVWALGVMLYECLSGGRPLVGSSVGQVVMKLMTDGIRPLTEVAPELPPEASDLVMRMLSRSREDRPQTLAEVTSVLAGLSQARKAPVRGRRRSAVVLLSAGALLLLALATWTAASLAKAHPGGRSAALATGVPAVASPPAPVDLSVAAAVPVSTSEPAAAPVLATTKIAAAVPAQRLARPGPAHPTAMDVLSEPVAAAGAKAAAVDAPQAPPPAAAVPATAPSATTAPIAPSSPPATTSERDCDPPYEFDRQGRKLWKRQCL